MKHSIQVGDKVLLDNDKVSIFVAETSDVSPEVTQYQKMVIEGSNQIGVVVDVGPIMATVSYEDGWDLPIPLKYLLLAE